MRPQGAGAAVFFLLAAPSAIAGAEPAAGEPVALANQLEGSDETLLVLPSFAYRRGGRGPWVLPIHGWIFEREPRSLERSALIDGLARTLEVAPADEARFRRRTRMFLVDNERGERVRVTIVGRSQELPRTGAHGHFEGAVELDDAALSRARKAAGRLGFEIETDQVRGPVSLPIIEPTGLSVISDIDDTIKITQVLDRAELLKNTFLRDFQPTQGMPAYYAALAARGALFHYVSASPWQLYPELQAFLDRHYPPGTVHLRRLRAKDPSVLEVLAGGESYKVDTISAIVKALPERKFVLIGDSGERDPEAYGRIARRFPRRIEAIYIRRVEGADNRDARFKAALARTSSASTWRVFDDPATLTTPPAR